MNLVYAIKILAAFSVLVAACAVLLRKGLEDLVPRELQRLGWMGILCVLALAAFGWRPFLFLLLLGVFSSWLSARPALRDQGHLPVYLLLVAIAPPIFVDLRDVGPIDFLMRLDAYRTLSLSLLLPFLLGPARRLKGSKPTWLAVADACMLVYSVLLLNRTIAEVSLSVVGRGVTEHVLDFLLPYFALSRGLRHPTILRMSLQMLLVGACFVSAVACVEFATGHLFYQQYQWLYGSGFALGTLSRGGWIRANGSAGPLATAVLLMVALGVWTMLRPAVLRRVHYVVPCLLVLGIGATMSRGPWLATGVLLGCLLMLRRWRVLPFLALAVVVAVSLAIAWTSGFDNVITDILAFGPSADNTALFNVRYRQELLNTAIALIEQSPLWGVSNYYAYMEHLRQGEGIIDLVNTYVLVTLNTGLVGLTFFLVPWMIASTQLGSLVEPADVVEAKRWLAIAVAMLAVIVTVSPVTLIQPLLLAVLGGCIGRASRIQERPAQ